MTHIFDSVKLSAEDFELVRFFSYTSCIPYKSRIMSIDYDECSKQTDAYLKFEEFYNALCDEASELYKQKTGNDIFMLFHDNKTVFQVRHKFSGKTYFIGRYDFERTVGTDCIVNGGTIYDLKTGKTSGYVDRVVANERGLWKEFKL